MTHLKHPLSFLATLAFTILFSIFAAIAHAQEPGAETTAKVQSVIDQQMMAFRAQDHDAAFSHASPGIRSMMGQSTDRFIGMVKTGYGAIYSARDFSFARNKMVGDTVYQEVLITGPDGTGWKALYTLGKQADGSWKIEGVQLVKDVAGST